MAPADARQEIGCSWAPDEGHVKAGRDRSGNDSERNCGHFLSVASGGLSIGLSRKQIVKLKAPRLLSLGLRQPIPSAVSAAALAHPALVRHPPGFIEPNCAIH